MIKFTLSNMPLVGCLTATLLMTMTTSSFAETTVLQGAGGGRNRIEVTGNSATNVQVECGDGRRVDQPAGNVNSVNVDPRALKGRTEIISGRNVRDVKGKVDCERSAGNGTQPAANINSINIR